MFRPELCFTMAVVRQNLLYTNTEDTHHALLPPHDQDDFKQIVDLQVCLGVSGSLFRASNLSVVVNEPVIPRNCSTCGRSGRPMPIQATIVNELKALKKYYG